MALWVKTQRAADSIVKAVLPNQTADCEGVVNFAAEGIAAGETAVSTAGYCSRIAGLLAGTPMQISATYAPLPEVTAVEKLTRTEGDAAIDAGKLILLHDGQKAKIARAVNSFTTTTADKGAAFQKIKIVETVDLIRRDIRRTCEDHYVGKFPNNYDNKCLLILAIGGYLESLERAELLQTGSTVGIDLAAQRNYLKSEGVDVDAMSEQQLKEAATGSTVFLTATVKVLDAIEDITLAVTM